MTSDSEAVALSLSDAERCSHENVREDNAQERMSHTIKTFSSFFPTQSHEDDLSCPASLRRPTAVESFGGGSCGLHIEQYSFAFLVPEEKEEQNQTA